MFDKLLSLGSEKLLIPLVVVAVGVALARGLFTVARSHSQDRKEFLDLFRNHEAQNDLWLTVAVRHVFGAYLPANLIRQLMSSPQPGRALLEVGRAWDFIDMDDETGELFWRRKFFRPAWARNTAIVLLAAAYFVLACAAILLAYVCLTGNFDGKALWIAWTYAILSALGALAALTYGDNLKDASKAISRWLGLH